MKATVTPPFLCASFLLALVVFTMPSVAQPLAFTYQGRLADGANPANGIYDLRFTLYDAPIGGSALWNQTSPSVPVTNGLFTIVLGATQSPLPSSAFDGSARWLAIEVKPGGSAAEFTTLAPRQAITHAPYAIYAPKAGAAATAGTAASANSVAAANITCTIALSQLPGALLTNGATGVNMAGTFTGDGAGLTNLIPSNVNGTFSAAQIPNLDASKITSGTFAGSRIPDLDAAKITTGSLADARLSSNVPRLDAAQSFTGTNTFTSSNLFNGVVRATNQNNSFVGTFTGDGAGLTNLIPSNVNGTFSAAQIPNLDASKITSGTFAGSRIPDLDATKITTGTLADARLSSNVPRLDKAQSFTGANAFTSSNHFSGIIRATNQNNSFVGTFTGDGAGLTNLSGGNIAANSVGSSQIIDGSIVNLDISDTAAIADTKLATIATPGKVANAATTASSGNVPNAIVTRDASGNFSAGTISANLAGNAATATMANNFSGALSGDVAGPQSATVVATVGGQTAANIASGAIAANTASSANTANTIVRRDASGNFSAGTIAASSFSGSGAGLTGLDAGNISGTLSIAQGGTGAGTAQAGLANLGGASLGASNIFSGVNALTNENNIFAGRFSGDGSGLSGLDGGALAVGSVSAVALAEGAVGSNHILDGTIVNADISAAAAIADTKLATIISPGKVANSATTASSENIPNGIVARNASGNFSAGTITANLAGNAATATTANNFSGALSGNVTGTQSATVVATVGGQSAANIASGATAANAASSANTANAIVKRDPSGGFSAGAITASSFSGSGAGLISLNASQLTSGTVALNRLPGSVLTNNATGVNLAGAFSGDGSGLVNVPGAIPWETVLVRHGPPDGAEPCLSADQ